MTSDVEIWLYGSRARGDADERSDTDVLVVTDDELPEEWEVPGVPGSTISAYSWSEIEAMHAYGSLFLLHLGREGVRLSPTSTSATRLDRLLLSLGPFQRVSHDLRSFRLAQEEAVDSIANGGWFDLELQVLGTVARHAAILGCYCIGSPCFGRERPFFELSGHGLIAEETAIRLARLSTTYRYTPLGASIWDELESESLAWLEDLRLLIERLEEFVGRKESTLRATA